MLVPSTPPNRAAAVNALVHYQILLTLVLGLIPLAFTGCRGASSVQIDVMEQELRQQEDYIYELEDCLVEYSEKLRRARSNNQSKEDKSKSATKPITLLEEGDLKLEEPSESSKSSSDNPTETIPDIKVENPAKPATSPKPDQTPGVKQTPESTQTNEPEVAPEPNIPEDLEKIEVPDLEIENPNARIQNRSRQPSTSPTNIQRAEVNRVSSVPSDTETDLITIPDPATFQYSAEISPQDDRKNRVSQAMLESELPPFEDSNEHLESQLTSTYHSTDELSDFEDSASLDRIVIEQLMVNSPYPAEPHSAVAHSSMTLPNGAIEQTSTHPESLPPVPSSLRTVVEILDLNNEPVEVDGQLSLMVMALPDSQSPGSDEHPGKPQRLQRWEFTSDELSQSWQSSSLGDGLHLELPLDKPDFPPQSLELWARLVTSDGNKYLTKRPFEPHRLVAWQNGPTRSPNRESLDRREGKAQFAGKWDHKHQVPQEKKDKASTSQFRISQFGLSHTESQAANSQLSPNRLEEKPTSPQWRTARNPSPVSTNSSSLHHRAGGHSPQWAAQKTTKKSGRSMANSQIVPPRLPTRPSSPSSNTGGQTQKEKQLKSSWRSPLR